MACVDFAVCSKLCGLFVCIDHVFLRSARNRKICSRQWFKTFYLRRTAVLLLCDNFCIVFLWIIKLLFDLFQLLVLVLNYE